MKKNAKKKNPQKNRRFLKICLPVIFCNSNGNIEFIRNTKKSRMFLRTGFVELLIFY